MYSFVDRILFYLFISFLCLLSERTEQNKILYYDEMQKNLTFREFTDNPIEKFNTHFLVFFANEKLIFTSLYFETALQIDFFR